MLVGLTFTTSFAWTLFLLLLLGATSGSARECFYRYLVLLLVLDVCQITSTAALVGSQEVNCSDLVVAALIPLSTAVLMRGRNRSVRPLFAPIAALSLAVLAGAILSVAMPVDDATIVASQSWDAYYFHQAVMTQPRLTLRSLLVLFRLAAYCLTLCAACTSLKRADYLRVARAVFDVSKVQVLFVALELLEKLAFHTNRLVLLAQGVFPSYASVMTTVNTRGAFVTLQGFTREPSHLALALFLFVSLYLFLWRVGSLRRGDRAWVLLALVLMLASAAFTSVTAAATLGLLALAIWREKARASAGFVDARIALMLVAAAVTAALAFAFALPTLTTSYYFQKAGNVLLNLPYLMGGDYGSLTGSSDALPRMISIFESLRMFLERPLFGIGIGVMNPFTGVGGMLASIGLVGTAAWFAMMSRYAHAIYGGSRIYGFYVMFVGIGLLGLDAGAMYQPCWILFAGLAAASQPLAVSTAPNRVRRAANRAMSNAPEGFQLSRVSSVR